MCTGVFFFFFFFLFPLWAAAILTHLNQWTLLPQRRSGSSVSDSEEWKWPDEYVDWREGGGCFQSAAYCQRPSPNCQECSVAHSKDTLPPSNSISDEILAVIMFPLCVNIRWSFYFLKRCADKKCDGKVQGQGLSLSMNRRMWFFTSMLLWCVCGFRSAIRGRDYVQGKSSSNSILSKSCCIVNGLRVCYFSGGWAGFFSVLM